MMFPLRKGPLPDAIGNLYGWQITSYFGGRIDPLTGRVGVHGGMDLAFYGCAGQPMIAAKSGLLSQGWDSSGGGNWSSLFCDDGDYFGYGHASSFAFTGGGSRWVEAGTIIAFVGTTGGSTGPHLHFAYRPKSANTYRDPYDLLVEAAGTPATPNTPPAPPVTIKEAADMGCVFAVNGHQYVIDGGRATVIRSDAHRHLLLRTLNAVKHPLANGDEWIEITDPAEVAAFNDAYLPGAS